jgi:hypothetical protein
MGSGKAPFGVYTDSDLMKNSSRMLPVIGVFFLARTFATAQNASQPNAAAEPWFSVNISTPDETTKVGSNVVLYLVFVNNTGKDLYTGAGGPGRGGPVFDLDVRDSRHDPVPETAYGLRMQGKDPHPFAGSVFRATVPPGGTIKEGLSLNKEYDLSKAGKYTVQLVERHPAVRAVRSNIVTITVHP